MSAVIAASGSHVAETVGHPCKGFVEVRGRLVHYVRQGTGPVAVLLHASPCSAKVMASLQAEWAAEFTTFAFDLPGFGLSELPREPEITIPLLAEIIAEAMDLLNIGDAALYGRHTGAAVALEIALARPEKTSLLLTDGLPVFTTPYTEERLREYLPPILPVRDGLHLVWAFFRYREQHMFWPWDAADIDHRADADMPDPDFLHRGAVELLEAASTYAQVYRSAFLHQTLPRLPRVRVPACYGNRPGDSQFKTIPHYPADAPVKVFSRDPEKASAQELEILRRHPARSPAPAMLRRFAEPQGSDRLRDYLPTRHGDVQTLGLGMRHDAVPLVYLHDLPGGFSLHGDHLESLARTRPVFAFDLGGNSESLIGQQPCLDLWTDQLSHVTQALNLDRFAVLAHGTSAPIALRHAIAHPGQVERVILQSPPLLTPQERAALLADCAPDIAPVADGGHMLRLWHHLRDQELWYPWFRQDHTSRRMSRPRIDPAELTRRAVTLLKQPRNYLPIWQAVLSADVPDLLSACEVPVEIGHDSSDLFAFTVQRRAQAG